MNAVVCRLAEWYSKKWQGWTLVECLRVVYEGKMWNLVIDGGSMDNIILKEATDKLKLLMNKHPHPYKIWWLKKEHEILITSKHIKWWGLVTWSWQERAWDVVSVVVWSYSHWWPWLLDHDMEHKMKPNTYSFSIENKRHLYLLLGKRRRNRKHSPKANKTELNFRCSYIK